MADTIVKLGPNTWLQAESTGGDCSSGDPAILKVSATFTSPTPGASSMTKAEDAAHVSGDVGIAVFAKRTDTAAPSSATDGDYVTINEDSLGRVWVNPGIIQNEDAAHTSGDAGVVTLLKRTDTAAASSATDGDYVTANADSTGRLWVNPGIIQNEDAVAGSGDAGVMVLAVRADSAAATSANGDYHPHLVDANGRLHVIEPSAAAAAASLSVIDDWDSTDACKSVAIQKSVAGTVGGANTVAAAGDYTALDIMSDSATNTVGAPWKFTGLGRVASGTGTIVGGKIETSVEGFVPRTRLWLFNAQPGTTSELDDNAVFYIDLDDRAKLMSYIDFPAMADVGEFSFAQVTDLNRQFVSDSNGDVWGVLQLLDAATNESAGMSVWPTLRVIQD